MPFLRLNMDDLIFKKVYFSSQNVNFFDSRDFFHWWKVFLLLKCSFLAQKPFSFPAPKWSFGAPAQHLLFCKTTFPSKIKIHIPKMWSFEQKKDWIYFPEVEFRVKMGIFCSTEGAPSPKMEVSSPKMEGRGKNRSFVLPNPLFSCLEITAFSQKLTFSI